MSLVIKIMQQVLLAALFFLSPIAAQDNNIKLISKKNTTSVFMLPNVSELPENTLRIYLNFSEPMAYGQVRESIKLKDKNGNLLSNSFLNLGVELWDPMQRRLTLLFDPGRIKRGVGPNINYGPPLKKGNEYILTVSALMKNAKGVKLLKDFNFLFSVVDPIRDQININDWKIIKPQFGTSDSLNIEFTRILDIGNAKRMINIVDHKENKINGRIYYDGEVWKFYPEVPWNSNKIFLHVNPNIEDISGNSIIGKFDKKKSKEIKNSTKNKIIEINIFDEREI